MARLYESGFELNSATAGMEWGVVTNGTVQSSTVRSGTYAGQVTSLVSGAGRGFAHQFQAATGNGPYWARFYFRAATLPSAENSIFRWTGTSPTITSGVPGARLTIDNTGTVKLYDGGGTLIGTAGVTLTTGVWYCLELKYDVSPASGSRIIQARIDGGTAFGTTTSVQIAQVASIVIGANIGAEAQTTGSWFFDDIAVNDSAAGTGQTSYPGSGKLVLAKPTGAGDSAATTGIFSYINEIPPTDTATSGSTMIELDANPTNADYNVTNTGTLGIAATDVIKLVSVWARVREESSGTSNYTLRLKSASGGTVASSASVDAGDTTARTNPNGTTAFGNRHVSYTDPTTAAAWTPTGTNSIENMQVGVGTTDGNPDTWVLWLGAYVEYASPLLSQTEAGFYEDGTETGSTAIDSGADSITRDVSSGDSNIQLRVRLQETDGIAGLATDDYQLQYELNDSGSWMDAGSASVVSTYYLDGSDAGVTDPAGAWTDDANAFDGSTATIASTSAPTGSLSSRFLKAEGTNAPAAGGAITQVRARVYAVNSGDSSGGAGIYTDGLGELLGTPFHDVAFAGWNSYVTLSAPSGGWTWAKIQALETKIYYDNLDSGSTGVSRVEIEVTSDNIVLGFNSGSLTDGNATTNRLGSGSGSFVAGEISEDGLVDNLQITASNYTELLYSLTIDSDSVVDNDTLDFRVLRNGATTGLTYTVTPRITIEESTTSAVVTGTIVPSVTEGDIVTGGKTLIITLTGDTWIAAGALSFDLQRDEIIAGVDSAQSEATGWDLVPKATQSLGGVVRTSDTVVTITWDAFPTYNITAIETITVTIPGTALTGGVPIVATPTFTITNVSASRSLSLLGVG